MATMSDRLREIASQYAPGYTGRIRWEDAVTDSSSPYQTQQTMTTFSTNPFTHAFREQHEAQRTVREMLRDINDVSEHELPPVPTFDPPRPMEPNLDPRGPRCTMGATSARADIRQGSFVTKFPEMDKVKQRLDAIERVLSADPEYADGVKLEIEAEEANENIKALVHEFDEEAVRRGLVDISDPANRELANLCRDILHAAEKANRRVLRFKQYNESIKKQPAVNNYARIDNAKLAAQAARIKELEDRLAALESNTDPMMVSLPARIHVLEQKFEELWEHDRDNSTMIESMRRILRTMVGKIPSSVPITC